jgi:hypothetical protein
MLDGSLLAASFHAIHALLRISHAFRSLPRAPSSPQRVFSRPDTSDVIFPIATADWFHYRRFPALISLRHAFIDLRRAVLDIHAHDCRLCSERFRLSACAALYACSLACAAKHCLDAAALITAKACRRLRHQQAVTIAAGTRHFDWPGWITAATITVQLDDGHDAVSSSAAISRDISIALGCHDFLSPNYRCRHRRFIYRIPRRCRFAESAAPSPQTPTAHATRRRYGSFHSSAIASAALRLESTRNFTEPLNFSIEPRRFASLSFPAYYSRFMLLLTTD